MSATYSQARDEMFALFKTAWDETGFSIVWPDKPGEKPSLREPWARITLRHAGGSQATLSGYDSKKRWRRRGTLFIQVFTPSGEGLTRSYELAKVVSDAFEGASTPSGVWFRNTRINEIGADGDWFQTNVVTDFIYDEIK